MANWKKVIVSGSIAEFSGITSSNLTNDNIIVVGPGGELQDSGLTLSGNILDIGVNSIQSTGTDSILSGSFSGSFQGDGSGLTGLPTTLTIEDDSNTTDTVDLLTDTLNFEGGTSLTTTVTDNKVSIGVDNGGITETQLNTSVAGTGLSGGGGTPLSVDYGSTAGTAVEGDTTMAFTGVTNEITIDAGGTQTLGNPSGVTIGLADTIIGNRTFQDDITINGDLVVEGTASFQESTNTTIADRFILLASGSAAAGDGGIVVQQSTQDIGEVFTWDNASSRWGVASGFDASSSNSTPDAFMASVLTGAAPDQALFDDRYEAKGNIFVGDDEEIWIYS